MSKPGHCIECGRKSDTLICSKCYKPAEPEDRKGEFVAAYRRNGQMIGKPQGGPRR